MPMQTEKHRLRTVCIDEMTNVYAEMTAWTSESPAKLALCGRRFFCTYMQLAAMHRNNENWLYWRITPKFHLLLHLVEDQASSAGNPALLWCYADEREIGNAVHIAQAVHPSTFNKTVMMRYRLW
jgi:uncharacterized protein YqcC (DUF446 family)